MISLDDDLALSRLLDGDLPPDEAAALQQRVATEPELAAAWAVMSGLPQRVEALPDVAMPEALEANILAAVSAASEETPRRRPWFVSRSVLALGVAAAAAVVLGLWLASDDAGPGPDEVAANPTHPVEAPEDAAPDGTHTAELTIDQAGTQVALFAPELPHPPRRLPHRPQRYTQPPPGGPMQFEAVDAARRRDCAAALSAVQRGMRASRGHASLYKGAWFCFNDTHQRKLEQTRAQTWEDFESSLHHFDGPPEALDAQERQPEIGGLPAWIRPPVGGIEYRLQTWTHDPQLVGVLDDLFGAPTVADHIAKDVHLEALAAAGLAREYGRRVESGAEPDPVLEQAWARRVYIATQALEGRPGRVLGAHRSELVPELRALLEEAVSGRELASGKTLEVPQIVLDARDTATGAKAPPAGLRNTTVPPYRPIDDEPTLDNVDVSITIDGKR